MVRPREGVWGGFLIREWIFGARERREEAWKWLRMVSGCVWGGCDALARVSARSEREKPPKFTENQEPESESLTVP